MTFSTSFLQRMTRKKMLKKSQTMVMARLKLKLTMEMTCSLSSRGTSTSSNKTTMQDLRQVITNWRKNWG